MIAGRNNQLVFNCAAYLTAAEYRRELGADTWRFCSNCSQWPTSDFISTADLTGRPQICTEYVAIVGLFVALED
jgi:hypothetical protein